MALVARDNIALRSEAEDHTQSSKNKSGSGEIGFSMGSGGGISNLLGGTKKNDSSTTHSDIAAGTVVVRDGNESALAGLDRTATGFDTDSALSAVDLRKMQERAEVMQLGGQLLFKGVGDLGGYLSQKAETEEGKAFWADGGNGRTLLHGMAGAAMAALGGADALKGVVSAAGAENAKIAISEFLESNKGSLSWEDYQSLMEVGSAMVGGALGGSTGANIAVTGDRFNRQLHPDEVKWINMNAAAFAAQEGISEAEAVRRLTTEGAARVDAKVNRLVGNENVDLEATAFLSKMGGTYGFTATEAEYNNFNLYGKELLKDDALYRQVFNSLLASGISKDDLNYSFFDLNGLRATMGRGRDGQMMLETFSGDVGAAGGVIASVAKGDGNGAAIGAATFLIPVRLPGAKIVGEVGAEIAGTATKQGVLRSEEILKSVQNAGVDAIEVGESAIRAGAAGRPADALRLSTQLAYEEAGILTRGGNALTKEAVRSSREIPISGGKLTNPAVVKELTSDGSRIEDWGKFTTQTIVLPSGQRSQIHYYMNKVTGKLNFNIDFKVKGRVE